MDISKKSGGLEGIICTYCKPAILKVCITENPHLTCESDKIGGRDAQMVKYNSMLFGLIKVSTKKNSAMDNGCLWRKSTFFVANSRIVEFARISAQVVVGIKL